MSKTWQFFIVTPSYNQAEFITQSVSSVTSQHKVKVQLLVMDGGSSDGTVSILKKLSRDLRWLSQKDGGQSDALNKGLKKVLAQVPEDKIETSIFAYLNSDDYYLPGALEKVQRAFQEHSHVSWVVGDCQIVDRKGKKIQGLIQIYKAVWRRFLTFNTLLILNPIPQPSVFVKLAAVKKVGYFNQELHYTMDYEYWLRVWRKFGRPLLLSDTLSAFRIHENSKGSQSYSRQFDEQSSVAKLFTQNKTWHFLQTMHNMIITFCYSLIK